MDELSISVCMATYNGETHLREQLDSILCQLGNNDEVVISDDGSSDNTLKIIEQYVKYDGRIRLVFGPRDGFSNNFANAIENSKNDIIVFSDQDDVWVPNKIAEIKKVFKNNIDCTTILHKMYTFSGEIKNAEEKIPIEYHKGVIYNIIRSSYWGCCMAVKREFIKRFLPFRAHCVGHDQLTGLLSERYGKTVYIKDKLIYHRLHNGNTSGKLSTSKKIQFRMRIIGDYIYATKKARKG